MIDFNMVKLSECCVIQPPKKQSKHKVNDSDLVTFAPMNKLGINNKELAHEESKALSSVYSGYTYFAENDVLLAKITPCFENGKLGIAKNLTNGIGFGSSEFIVLRAKENLLSEYLYFYLLRPAFRESGRKVMTGAVGHKRVPKDFINNLLIPLPPLETQARIVSILDSAFADIERARAIAEKNLKNARELFDSYLNKVFTEGGDGWENKSFGEVLTLNYGKGLDKGKRDPNGKYPAYGANGIKCYTNEYLHEKDTIIVGRKGSAGELTLSSGRCWPLDVTYFTSFDESAYELKFIYYMMTTKDIPSLANGVKPGINRNNVYSLNAPIPCIDEQVKIANALDLLLEKIKKLENRYENKLKSLDELKQSLLQKAFSGELTREDKGIAA